MQQLTLPVDRPSLSRPEEYFILARHCFVRYKYNVFILLYFLPNYISTHVLKTFMSSKEAEWPQHTNHETEKEAFELLINTFLKWIRMTLIILQARPTHILLTDRNTDACRVERQEVLPSAKGLCIPYSKHFLGLVRWNVSRV